MLLIKGVKMYKKYFLLALSLCFILTSCKEDDIKKSDDIIPFFSFLASGDYSEAVGTITFDAGRINQNEYGEFYCEARAQAFTTTAKNSRTYAGNIKIGNFNLIYSPTDTSYNDGYTSVPPDLTSLFGTTTTIEISGSSNVASSTISLYCPKRMEMRLNDLLYLDKSQDLEITWNSDNNNPNDVAIALFYDGDRSNAIDSNLSDVSYAIYHTTTADDGSYTIPYSAFLNLTAGSRVFLMIGRGVAVLDGASTDKFIVKSYSFDRQPLEVTN